MAVVSRPSSAIAKPAAAREPRGDRRALYREIGELERQIGELERQIGELERQGSWTGRPGVAVSWTRA